MNYRVGRMKFGETIEDTLIREMKEELNLDVISVKIVDTWNYLNEAQTHQVAGIIYYCNANNLDSFLLSLEHTDYKWFYINDVSMMNILYEKQTSRIDWKQLNK